MYSHGLAPRNARQSLGSVSQAIPSHIPNPRVLDPCAAFAALLAVTADLHHYQRVRLSG